MKTPFVPFPKLVTSNNASSKVKAAADAKPDNRFEDALNKAMGTPPPIATRDSKPKERKLKPVSLPPSPQRLGEPSPAPDSPRVAEPQRSFARGAPAPAEELPKVIVQRKTSAARSAASKRPEIVGDPPSKEPQGTRSRRVQPNSTAEQTTATLAAQALPLFARTHPTAHAPSEPSKSFEEVRPPPAAKPTAATASPGVEAPASTRASTPTHPQHAPSAASAASPAFELSGPPSAPVQTLAQQLPPAVLDDPSLRIWVSNGMSQLQVEGSDGTPMRVKFRNREGVMDVTVSGSSAPQFIQRENELRMVLAQEGLTLGQLDLSQQGQGAPQQDRWQVAQEQMERPSTPPAPRGREEAASLHNAQHLNVKA